MVLLLLLLVAIRCVFQQQPTTKAPFVLQTPVSGFGQPAVNNISSTITILTTPAGGKKEHASHDLVVEKITEKTDLANNVDNNDNSDNNNTDNNDNNNNNDNTDSMTNLTTMTWSLTRL